MAKSKANTKKVEVGKNKTDQEVRHVLKNDHTELIDAGYVLRNYDRAKGVALLIKR